MKRSALLLVILALILSSLACGSSTNQPESPAPTATAAAPVAAPTGQLTAQPTATQATKEAEPTAEPAVANASQLGDTQTVGDGGFTFRTIPDYNVQINGGMAIMLAPGADADLGPAVNLIGGTVPATTPKELYEKLKRDIPMTVSEARPVTVAGIAGLVADISGNNNGHAMRGRAVMVMVTSTRQFILLAGAPEADWPELERYLNAILSSVEFVELPASAPTSNLKPGWYTYVNANVVRDLVVYKGVVYAATLGGMVAWRLDSGYAMPYTPQQGMSHVSAYAIAYCEMPEPRIVVGTQNGVSVYDPNTGLWEPQGLAADLSHVAERKVTRLYCDQANNRLLIGYSGLGVLDLNTGDWQKFTTKEGLAADEVTDITVLGKDIWVASGYKGVARISGGKVTAYTKNNGLPDDRTTALAAAPDGTLWVGASSGLLSFKDGKWTLYGNDKSAKLADINEIEIAADGRLWVATAPLGIGRLCQFTPQSGTCDVDFKEQDSQAILALALGKGELPIYGTGKGVYVFENGAAKAFKTEDKLASNFVDALAAAPDGKLWVGTDAGLHLLDPADPAGAWTTFRAQATPGLGGNWASSIASTPEGVVWAAIVNGAASRYQDGTWTSFKDIYSFNVVAVDAQHRAWFGDDGKGIRVLNADGSPALTLTKADGLPSDNVQALLARGQTVWIGTDQGLAKYEDGQLSVVFGKDDKALPNKYIRALALDANEALIIGTFTGVARYDYNQVEVLVDFLKDGFADARLTTLAIVPNGRLWVGTDKGLLYSDDWADWTMLTIQDGLLTNYISALWVDQYGAAWIGGGGSNFDGGGLLLYVP